MAKQSGIGASFYAGTADISGDVGAVTRIETSRIALDVTAINESAMERLSGRRDGALDFMAFWNTAASQAHATLSALPRTDVLCSCFLGGTLGYPAASINAKQLNYAPTRGTDGSLGAAVNTLGSGFGLEWGVMLSTGKQSFSTGTVDGTGIDDGASSAFGGAAYLQVFSVASGTAVFAVQDSTDNVTFADVTGLVFTGATGATTQRLQTAAGATINRYVRLEGRGTHGATVVAVNFVRYTEAGPV
jgi:hypothetical protein